MGFLIETIVLKTVRSEVSLEATGCQFVNLKFEWQHRSESRLLPPALVVVVNHHLIHSEDCLELRDRKRLNQ